MSGTSRRAACYCLTRNIYEKAVPSLKSLLANTRVDAVYMLIEDDGLPFAVPECVKAVNVSGQEFFRPDGPNYRNGWTWMVMMRAALANVLTDEDRVLSLDADTIVRGDVGALWDVDLAGKYLAAVNEPSKGEMVRGLYVNNGVAVYNLRMLRDGTADRMIASLNAVKYSFVEQDCINALCKGQILALPSRYNASLWTGMPPEGEILIRHYAAERGWFDKEEVRDWLKREWSVKTD